MRWNFWAGRLEVPVRHTSICKIYVEEMYWQDTSINQTNQLPFDIDGNCIFKVPSTPTNVLIQRKMEDTGDH